ncbi:MAG: ChbG/HpnK family deacetylase, partial [Chloroflexota bacterium]|nr:ChbG/HpnK family deacetylase [Chloroflexota bacterium]
MNLTAERYLIVNADDFGLSTGVNRGIMRAHQCGIVTSASLMVRGRAAEEAAAYAREHPELSLGLHVDLCEWVYDGRNWTLLYEVVAPDDPVAVEEEVRSQLATFRALAGKDPTHLDSHQHVHLNEPARSVLAQVGRETGAPLRGCSPGVRYCGDFYGQSSEGAPFPEGISADNLVQILARLPAGISELG